MEGLSLLTRPQTNGRPLPEWPAVMSAFHPEEVGPALSAFQRPTRIEGDIFNLEVYGEIPKCISGTFYRIMPDPAFPPFLKNDIWINGDGVVSSFRIQNGHVDFKQRYVNTEKLQVEKALRRALAGKYRNPFTDLIDFRTRTVANTTIFPYRDKILALKEDGPPYAMNPITLQTDGIYDFEGQWDSETFTAHPKYDAVARELLTFGYEAKGLGTKDILYGSFDQHGHRTEKVWFQAPVCGFQHEMAATKNYVLFPIIPMNCNIEKMKEGGMHWEWQQDRPYYIGVLPRRGAKASDVKWFYGDNAYIGHVANAWEEDGKIHLYQSYANGNVFGFFPDKNGDSPPMGTNASRLAHWVIDYHAEDLQLKKPEILVHEDNEFLRIDDRYTCYKSNFVIGVMLDRAEGKTDWKLVGERVGGGYPPFNTIYMKNLKTGKLHKYWNGQDRFFQEPVFIPRTHDAAEGDGYLIALTLNFTDMISELVILDTQDITKHVALCPLPIRLRMGIHGNWIDDADVQGHGQPQPASIH